MKADKRSSGAELAVSTLRDLGVELVFGVPGLHALPLYEALDRDPQIRHIAMRHEQGAAFAADGYARTSGRLGVCLVTPGPGSANTGAGLIEAYASSSPVLVLVAQIHSRLLGREIGAIHEVKDHGLMLDGMCKERIRIGSPAAVVPGIRWAAGHARAGRPGPVAVELPVDVLLGVLDSPPAAEETSKPVVPESPDPATIEGAVKALAQTERPLILAGGGVIRAGAWDLLRMLAEALEAPTLVTFQGTGSLPASHPLFVGNISGLFPYRGRPDRGPFWETLWRNADTLVAIGTRFTEASTMGWKLEIPQFLIRLDAQPPPEETRYPSSVSLIGDARTGLEVLLRALGRPTTGRVRWDGRAALLARRVREQTVRLLKEERPLEWSILHHLRKAFPPKTIVANDMTMMSYWSGRYFPVEMARTFLYPFGSVPLGFGLPASIGAALAAPGTPVAVLVGDGGFLFSAEELAVLAHENLPVTVVLFNDNAYAVLADFLEATYGRTFETTLHNPDFLKLAAAFEVSAWQVEDPESMGRAVSASVHAGRPALIEYQGTFRPPWIRE